jgi:small-conductance mechanosensitive channel
MSDLVPILGVLTGIIIPLAVFFWLYQDDKDKRQTVLEIAKHLDDPRKVEQLLGIFDERKKEPVDYRRGGVISLFVGVGIYLLGMIVLGRFFEGIGLLVGAIGAGVMIAGYFFPNTSEEITSAVEKFEEK